MSTAMVRMLPEIFEDSTQFKPDRWFIPQAGEDLEARSCNEKSDQQDAYMSVAHQSPIYVESPRYTISGDKPTGPSVAVYSH